MLDKREDLARKLNLQVVQVPLIVEAASGMNDMLDRDSSRTPVEFDGGLGIEKTLRRRSSDHTPTGLR